MLRRLYDWTLQKAATPAAEWWLAIVAFVESSVFLIPADVLFVPMALAKPTRAYRYALTATLASTLGGIAGYYLGHYAYEQIAKPVLAFYSKLHVFEELRSSTSKDATLLMLVTSARALAAHQGGDHSVGRGGSRFMGIHRVVPRTTAGQIIRTSAGYSLRCRRIPTAQASLRAVSP